ncbi:MAG: hypothetical protein EOP49_07600 [Sphingobacteriales bacterium]|nr:MAG: hypothetical protein EOP49_07600 [Sphingobacteriales bacterium]
MKQLLFSMIALLALQTTSFATGTSDPAAPAASENKMDTMKKSSGSVSIYPTVQTMGQPIHFERSEGTFEEGTIAVTDFNGNLIREWKVAAGTGKITAYLNGFEKGYYLFHVVSGKTRKTERVEFR